MGKAAFARGSKRGSVVSKSLYARTGNVSKGGEVFGTSSQPSVPSNIPNSDSQGVPDASRDQMAALARSGNEAMMSTVVSTTLGEAAYGPKVASSVARTGGQVRLAPNQARNWAAPRDAAPKTSTQVLPATIPTKVV